LAAGVALLVLVALQPFLLTNPGLLWQTEGIDDFGLAVKVAQGKVLQPWTLVDVHTVPYLDHWALWSLVSSRPFAPLFVCSFLYVLWLGKPPLALMALWCALCFLLVGQLPVRAVRYLVPMLPFLALFSGAVLSRVWHLPAGWPRLAARSAVVLLLGHLAYAGLSFARVYREEDSRIQAGRWLAQHVAPGTRIGIEGGGFSMQPVISNQSYQHVRLDAMRIFYTSPYLSCSAQLEFLREGLQDTEYIAITDVNRYAQFTAVPELFPVVAGLYQRLVAGDLGFALVQRFKTSPGLGGLVMDDQGAEPSFLGYDHPTVWIFRSTGPEGVRQALAHWESELEGESCCPDRQLRQAVALLAGGDWQQVKNALRGLDAAHPDLALGHRLLVEVRRHLGETDSAAAALVRYRLPGWAAAPASIAFLTAYASADSAAALLDRYRSQSPRTAHILHQATLHYIPSSTARSFAGLGLNKLALQVLKDGADESMQYPPQAAAQMALSYLEVAGLLSQVGDSAGAEQAEALAARIRGGG
jgi:hypothetical protein